MNLDKWFPRRKIVVNRKLQHSITLLFVCMSLIQGILVLALFSVYSRGILTQMSEVDGIQMNAVLKAVTSQSIIAFWWLLGYICFVALFSWFAGLVLLHRVAGPIVSICNYLKGVNEGTVSKEDSIRIRKGDYFSELVNTLNPVMKKYFEALEKNEKESSKE